MRVCLLLFVAAIAACEKPQPKHKRQGNLAARVPVPDFTFLEARDVPLSRKDLAGKVWICTFVFTSCPTHCPPMAREMFKIQEQFLKEKDFRIVSVTVDPARDTPEAMRKFLKNYRGREGRWYFGTGKRSVLSKFAYDLGIPGDPEEPLNHSFYFVLVDRKLRVRDYYDLNGEGRMAQLRKDIRTLLAE